jgi:hypothetical protein
MIAIRHVFGTVMPAGLLNLRLVVVSAWDEERGFGDLE